MGSLDHHRLTIPRLLVASFAAAIFLGALLLWMDLSRVAAAPAVTFVDALFTSCSAVCVTGLTVRDTGSEMSSVGQLIVLLLIQIGGLGIMTFSNMAILVARRKLDLSGRMMVEETHGLVPSLSPIGVLLAVLVYTAVIEVAGAWILAVRFARDMDWSLALWYGVFHSIAAFCNAGFALFKDNLMGYRLDMTVNLTIMGLIVLGGIGFVVLGELTIWLRGIFRRPRPRLSLHTRVVLVTTLILIFGGALLVGLTESGGVAMAGSFADRCLQSLFLSVTSRTAGFNTVDTGRLENSTLLVVIGLMFIGASSGSTGGGIKTTTAAILCGLLYSRVRNRPKIELFDRSVPAALVSKALATTAGLSLVVIVAVIALEVCQNTALSPSLSRGQFLEHLFEVVSAVGTVGLSTGVTTRLTDLAKIVLIACMFVGRVGPLCVASSLVGEAHRLEYTLPEENVIVG